LKLTKKGEKALDELIAELEAARDALIQAAATYGEHLTAAREFRDELVEQWKAEIEEKSERWQESPAGEAAAAFVEKWEELELDDLEFNPEEGDCGHPEALGEAPRSVNDD
jgi:hypothetical protein